MTRRALVGTTFSVAGAFYQAYLVREKGWTIEDSKRGLIDSVEGIVSLYDVRTYKPNPAAYAYFHRAAQTGGAETWLISSNPFDVIGAVAAGMRALWLRRSPHVYFDPWEYQPTATATSLLDAAEFFRHRVANDE